jgi:hypothetical protein
MKSSVNFEKLHKSNKILLSENLAALRKIQICENCTQILANLLKKQKELKIYC